MAIESITGKTINGSLPTRAASKTETAAKATVAKADGDVSIQLTAAAKDMSTVAVNSNQSDGVDEARVAAIKTAIENGSYRIDPERVAKKMLQFEEKLPDST